MTKLGSLVQTENGSSKIFCDQIVEWALDKKALDVVAIDVRDQSSYTDFIVIASGTSDRHVQSIAEGIAQEAKKAGHTLIGSEGMRSSQWALIDCGDVVVHVFHEFSRDMYRLEEVFQKTGKLRSV